MRRAEGCARWPRRLVDVALAVLVALQFLLLYAVLRRSPAPAPAPADLQEEATAAADGSREVFTVCEIQGTCHEWKDTAVRLPAGGLEPLAPEAPPDLDPGEGVGEDWPADPDWSGRWRRASGGGEGEDGGGDGGGGGGGEAAAAGKDAAEAEASSAGEADADGGGAAAPPPASAREGEGVYGYAFGCHERGADLTPAMREWVAMHGTVTDTPARGDRVLRFRPVGGLGNTLHGLASALLLGMLSGRAVYAEWPLLADHVRPCLARWDWFAASPVLRGMEFEERAEVDDCYLETNFTRALALEPSLDAVLPGQAVELTTNCPLARALVRNPAHAARLAELGLVGGEGGAGGGGGGGTDASAFWVVSRVLRLFVGLDSAPWEAARHVWQRLEGRHVVGVHVRVGGEHDDPDFVAGDAEVDRMFGCVDELVRAHRTASSREVSVYVASDDARAVERARERFGRDVAVSSPGNAAHTAKAPAEGLGQLVAKALIDVWTLARADDLVVTPGSTFGAAAALLGGTVPIVAGAEGEHCPPVDLARPPHRLGTNYPAW